MAADRIYFVGHGESERLVRATRQGPALTHVAEQAFTVRVATQNDLERLFARGVKVEVAGKAPDPAPNPVPSAAAAAGAAGAAQAPAPAQADLHPS